MYINETYSDQPNSQCINCRHYGVCKWRDEIIKVNTKISNAVFNEELPLEISVDCKRFSKQEKRVCFV